MRRRFIGNDQTRASAVQAVEATGMQTPPPRTMHPGNLSSLRNERSAFLQHTQGGYANPNIQNARYSITSMRQSIPDVSLKTLSPSIAGSLLDKRIVKSGSGSLAKLLKTLK